MSTETVAQTDTGGSQNATESAVLCKDNFLWYRCYRQCIVVTLKLRKKEGHATVNNADHRHPEEHLQTEWCGVITAAAFQIKQMKLRPQICVLWPSSWLEWTRSLCADSLTLMLFECDIPHGPASTGSRNRRKLESKQSKEWKRRTKRSMNRMWMDG